MVFDFRNLGDICQNSLQTKEGWGSRAGCEYICLGGKHAHLIILEVV